MARRPVPTLIAALLVVATACGSPASSIGPSPTTSSQSTVQPPSLGMAAPVIAASPASEPTPPVLEPTPTPFRVLPSPGLAQLADEAHVHVGSQIVWFATRDYPVYAEAAREVANTLLSAGELSAQQVFAHFDWHQVIAHWSYVNAELNAGRIPYENELDFSRADMLMAYAAANHMSVMAQFLFYSQEMPADLVPTQLSQSDLFKVIEYFVKARVLRYKGKITWWGATNEVVGGRLYGPPSYKIWYSQPWSDALIADVFKWAHEADPKAKLMLGDNSVLDPNNPIFANVASAYIAYLAQLRAEHVPITTAALQNHFWIYAPPELSVMEQAIRRIKALGLSVVFSETTVEESSKFAEWTGRPRTVESVANPDQAQAHVYADTLKAALDTGSVFVMFGFTDAISMFDAGSIHVPDARALILDADYHPKPAYNALVSTLRTYIASKATT